MGILFAFIALISWGIGDFLIQRSAKKFGDWEALFFVTFFGGVILTPFILKDIGSLFSEQGALIILMSTGAVMLLASLFNFEALKKGKISVVEPIFALEIPIAGFIASQTIGEHISGIQIALIVILVIGIMSISIKSFSSLKTIHLEKGIWIAVLSTIGMGIGNTLYGIGARATNPLLINWLVSIFIAGATFVYICWHHRVKAVWHDWKAHPKLICAVGSADILAWIAFAYCTLTIPIAIATGISESYIAIAALLGIVYNKEKLRRHQMIGLVITVLTACLLALTT